MRTLTTGRFAASVLALVAGLLAAPPAPAQTTAAAPPVTPEAGDLTELPRAVPRWLLQASNGRTATPEDFRGRFQLLAFGFVSCPDVCPSTLAEMKTVLDRLGPRAADLQPLFISVDPERDTLPVLREYTAAFDSRILGLTGPPALLQRAAQAFKVKFEKVPSPSGDPQAYTVDHTAAMFLVGPDGQLLSRLSYGMPVADIVARITRWMDAAQ